MVDLIVVGLLKLSINRRRPEVNLSADMAIGTNYGVDKFSFPSGHASRAILVSCLLSYLFKNESNSVNDYVSILVFLHLCSHMTCFSRILLARHYVTDVLGGVCIGYLISFIVLYYS